ncbi:hypothetical protein GQ607_014449 [Colletotrichum asianum]|uniref:CCHC-type domain-containing protein n=1 Tax=Colletotrichum asianum TaxID=702518 RepID=A0A8H3ZGI0_9PEZI|nr:hypothetical protein GQ607_014449 [Colletotrichum asianum]
MNCFHCKKAGHMMKRCPDKDEDRCAACKEEHCTQSVNCMDRNRRLHLRVQQPDSSTVSGAVSSPRARVVVGRVLSYWSAQMRTRNPCHPPAISLCTVEFLCCCGLSIFAQRYEFLDESHVARRVAAVPTQLRSQPHAPRFTSQGLSVPRCVSTLPAPPQPKKSAPTDLGPLPQSTPGLPRGPGSGSRSRPATSCPDTALGALMCSDMRRSAPTHLLSKSSLQSVGAPPAVRNLSRPRPPSPSPDSNQSRHDLKQL